MAKDSSWQVIFSIRGHLALPSKLSVRRKGKKKKENSSQLRELIQIISVFLLVPEAHRANSYLISAIVEGIRLNGEKLRPDFSLRPPVLNHTFNAM